MLTTSILKRKLKTSLEKKKQDKDLSVTEIVDEVWKILGLEKNSFFDNDNNLPFDLKKEKYLKDCQRIKKAFVEEGYSSIGLWDAFCLWRDFSDNRGVGWASLPEKDWQIFASLRHLLYKSFLME